MHLIPETIIRALCWTLLHSLWQGLILAVVAGVVMLLTKKAPSATRYTLLASLVTGFLLVSGYTFISEWKSTPGSTPAAPSFIAPVSGLGGAMALPAQSEPVQTNFIDQLVQYFNTHASVVVVIWFIVFTARFVRLLSGLVYAQRVRHYQTSLAPAEWQDRLTTLIRRLRISRPVRLLESALINVPVAVGWLKPVILVPVGMLAQLSADQVESILLHELAHIRRRDYLFNLIQGLVDTVFFFNPALLWVSSLIRTERENCCDDMAIRETQSRRQLIEALVSFHEYQQTARGYVLGFAGEKNGMVKRVERIVRKRNHSLNAGERLLLMGGVLVLCGAFITINGGQAAEPVRAKIVARQQTVIQSQGDVKPQSTEGIGVAVSASMTMQKRKRETISVDTAKPGGPASDSADIDKIIRAHDHGVTPEFIADLKKLGYTVNLDQAIELMDHGVNADFIRDVQKEGYTQISLKKAIDLVDHGATPEFIHQVKAEGFPNLTLNDAIKLVDHGVTVDFIREWKKKTDSKLELSDYIKLRDAGIDPS